MSDNIIKRIKMLNSFRKDEKCTDAILETMDGRKFPVHKIILMSGSEYFQKLFESDMVECEKNEILIKKDIPGDCMELIINYIYTGEIEIIYDMAKSLHENANYFNMMDLKELAENVLLENITLDNSLDLLRYSELHMGHSLKNHCMKFIQLNIGKFLNNSFIFDLQLEELETIIKNDQFNFDEEFVYEMIIKWIKADYDNRKIYIKKLLGKIDLGKINDEFKVSTILSDEVLMKNFDFLEIVANSWKKNLECEIKHNMSNTDRLVLVGNYIHELNLKEKKSYQKFETRGELCDNVSTNYMGNSIFLSYVDITRCQYYNLENESVVTLPCLTKKKSGHRVINVGNKIFVCGGSDRSVSELDICGGGWRKRQPMNFSNSSFSICNSDTYNCMYVATGCKDKTFEKCDIRMFNWIKIGDMDKFAGFTSMTCIGNIVYCFDKKKGLRFDLRMNRWIDDNMLTMNIEEPIEFRDKSFDCESLNGELYICGLTEKTKILMKYNEKLCRWIRMHFHFDNAKLENFKLIKVTD